MGISMNGWLVEKASLQVNCAAEIVRVLRDSKARPELERVALFTYPDGTQETVAKALEREALQIFRQACNILTYAMASPRDIHNGPDSCFVAFDKGAGAMKAYAQSIAAESVPEGWNLPNPAYHGLVINIERPSDNTAR